MTTKNERYILRLENLIRVMRGLSRHERTKHFNMESWGEETECGTTMCAAGFCGSDPWFRKRGFKFVRYPNSRYGTVSYKGGDSWSAIQDFFGTHPDDGDVEDNGHRIFSKPTTVGQVIRAAEKRIAQLRETLK